MKYLFDTDHISFLQRRSGSEYENLAARIATLTNQPTQTTEESFEFGEVDAALNFQPLTEAEMVEQSKFALVAYRSKGSGVPHNLVREWADSLGTDSDRSRNGRPLTTGRKFCRFSAFIELTPDEHVCNSNDNRYI